MKNLENVENVSNVSELNSTEMHEIVGGSWFSRLIDRIIEWLIPMEC